MPSLFYVVQVARSLTGSIGISLVREDRPNNAYSWRIAGIVPNSPAHKGGQLAVGDYIRAINEQQNLPPAIQDVVFMLRGSPGSIVSIVIERPQPHQSQSSRACTNCNAMMKPGYSFCNQCGFSGLPMQEPLPSSTSPAPQYLHSSPSQQQLPQQASPDYSVPGQETLENTAVPHTSSQTLPFQGSQFPMTLYATHNFEARGLDELSFKMGDAIQILGPAPDSVLPMNPATFSCTC